VTKKKHQIAPLRQATDPCATTNTCGTLWSKYYGLPKPFKGHSRQRSQTTFKAKDLKIMLLFSSRMSRSMRRRNQRQVHKVHLTMSPWTSRSCGHKQHQIPPIYPVDIERPAIIATQEANGGVQRHLRLLNAVSNGVQGREDGKGGCATQSKEIWSNK